MGVMIRSRLHLLLGCCSVFLVLVCFATAHADTLENGLREWDPSVIQGTIMDTAKEYIVISERWVKFVDTTIRSKHLKTRIVDNRGSEQPKGALKKGVLVLAKGGLAWDDKIKTNVLLATEIQILDKPVNLQDENLRSKFHEQTRLW
ncbi:MAG: hypothetical protein BWX71_01286 [Deltaproteobacteria bacterium ADurb.Bin072]|nr:MAG: hypothetical protein BWX71_01286 [Deltaproteobacteria bacterium ADurb.Bin072]